jgi:putative transposase
MSVDDGTAFASNTLDAWAYWNHVQLDFSRPGRPTTSRYLQSTPDALKGR